MPTLVDAVKNPPPDPVTSKAYQVTDPTEQVELVTGTFATAKLGDYVFCPDPADPAILEIMPSDVFEKNYTLSPPP